jgi:hypothetical protein
MTGFLTDWRKKVLANTAPKAASRQLTFEEGLAAFRKATGSKESRVIPCRCAQTGRPFTIRFERESPDHPFRVAGTETGGTASSDANGGKARFGSTRKQQAYDAAEFDWTGLSCPHCGSRSSVVMCNRCGETVCGGRVRSHPNGERSFTCHDGCGATAKIETARQVFAGAGHRSGSAGAAPLGKPAPTPTALPPRAYKGMLGAKRR